MVLSSMRGLGIELTSFGRPAGALHHRAAPPGHCSLNILPQSTESHSVFLLLLKNEKSLLRYLFHDYYIYLFMWGALYLLSHFTGPGFPFELTLYI